MSKLDDEKLAAMRMRNENAEVAKVLAKEREDFEAKRKNMLEKFSKIEDARSKNEAELRG